MTQPFPTFRDLLRKFSPPWLQRGLGEKLGYAITVQIDAMGEALDASVRIRFPNVYSSESLPVIGRERRIRRGQHEQASAYAGRLRRWLQDHQRRGGPHALLAQVRAYHLPLTFPIVLWWPSGARYRMDAAGVVTRDVVAWVPTAAWARWTLMLFSDSLGSLAADELGTVPREWNAAHCIGSAVVMPTGSRLWDYPPERLWDNGGAWNAAPTGARVEI
jgi:hypothetical protein